MIYLDNNSTTRVAPEVVEAMRPFWEEEFGNASSIHRLGQNARHAIELARGHVASLLHATPREIIFTSGGTEADNLAILGTLAAYPNKRHLVSTPVEHPAVFDLCQRLAGQDYRITFVPVDVQGRLDLSALEAAIGEDTAIVSIMHANNETGVLFPIADVAKIAAARRVPLHVDAVQTAGKMPLDVKSLGVSLLSLSSHKIHGPKGAGALFVGPGVRLRSQQVGGHQERDIRPGTENVAAIVGFGEAARRARERDSGRQDVGRLRDELERGILQRVPFAEVIGDPSARISNTSSIGFRNLAAEAILITLSEEGLCASSGSACSSGSLEPSHVLKAMGVEPAVAHGTIRFSLAHETTPAEIADALDIIPRVVHRLASLQ